MKKACVSKASTETPTQASRSCCRTVRTVVAQAATRETIVMAMVSCRERIFIPAFLVLEFISTFLLQDGESVGSLLHCKGRDHALSILIFSYSIKKNGIAQPDTCLMNHNFPIFF